MAGVRRTGKFCFKPDAHSFEEIPLFHTIKQEGMDKAHLCAVLPDRKPDHKGHGATFTGRVLSIECNGRLQRAIFLQNSLLNHAVKFLYPCFQHIFCLVSVFQQKDRIDFLCSLSLGNGNILCQKIAVQVFSQRNRQPERTGI